MQELQEPFALIAEVNDWWRERIYHGLVPEFATHVGRRSQAYERILCVEMDEMGEHIPSSAGAQ